MSRLNPEQFSAVHHTEGPLLVLAGAGSGKTQVITSRIVHLLKGLKVPAEDILAVTFTNKASKEMQERVTAAAGHSAKGMVISTFHSLGVRILRHDIKRIGYKPNFSIYTESDQTGVLRQAMRDLELDPKQYNPDAIRWRISLAKNRLAPPESYHPKESDPLDHATAAVYRRYQQLLRAFNAIDFDDIIMLAVHILETVEEARNYWQGRFRYLMVDEYQDTNSCQFRLIAILAELHGNLCVVGDDDQSIYGWRGAEVQNILSFDTQRPGCRVIKLEQNYRSTATILSAANAVIANNRKRSEKALWTSSGSGHPISMIVADDEEAEARQVVEQLQLAQYLEKRKWSDFAILYRSNAQSRNFEEALRMEGIPYILVGGMKFFERKEVKDTLAYLAVIANQTDEASLVRILNFPRRGINDELYRTLGDAAQARKRIENIEQVVSSIASYEERNPDSGISGFLERISLLEDSRRDAGDDRGEPEESVTLMSLHSSKGLEFPHVFLVGLEEGLFPHHRSVEEDPYTEEERRLCYVGITRAREKLVISRALARRKYGTLEQKEPSRFLAEIPEQLMEGNSHGAAPEKPVDMGNDFFSRMFAEEPS